MRIRTSLLATVACLATALPLSAQSSPPDFLEEFGGHFNQSSRKFTALAEAIPAADYDWRPMEGTSSVAEVFMHIARYNYY